MQQSSLPSTAATRRPSTDHKSPSTAQTARVSLVGKGVLETEEEEETVVEAAMDASTFDVPRFTTRPPSGRRLNQVSDEALIQIFQAKLERGPMTSVTAPTTTTATGSTVVSSPAPMKRVSLLTESLSPNATLSTLRRRSTILGENRPAVVPARTAHCASQTNLNTTQMDLVDFLLSARNTEQAPGGRSAMITATHALDRRVLFQFVDHQQINLVLDETWERGQLFATQRESFELFTKMFWLMFPRRRGTILIQKGNSYSLAPDPSYFGARDRSLSLGDYAHHRNGDAFDEKDLIIEKLESEVSSLQEKLRTVERQLLNKMKLEANVERYAHAVRKRQQIASIFTFIPEEIESQATKQREEMIAREHFLRGEVLHYERSAYQALKSNLQLHEQHELFQKIHRKVVHTPYTSYRPRIPLERSLQGEEFLRRWLLGETFKHYEDVMNMLQYWENDVRNAIEDERNDFVLNCEAIYFFPNLRRAEADLRNTVDRLQVQLTQYENESRSAFSLLKLRTIETEEAEVRNALSVVHDGFAPFFHTVSLALVTARQSHSSVYRLEKELVHQRVRHAREMELLRASSTQPQLAPRMTSLEAALLRTHQEASSATQQEARRSTLYNTISSDIQLHSPFRPPSAQTSNSLRPNSGYSVSGNRSAPSLYARPQSGAAVVVESPSSIRSGRLDYDAGF